MSVAGYGSSAPRKNIKYFDARRGEFKFRADNGEYAACRDVYGKFVAGSVRFRWKEGNEKVAEHEEMSIALDGGDTRLIINAFFPSIFSIWLLGTLLQLPVDTVVRISITTSKGNDNIAVAFVETLKTADPLSWNPNLKKLFTEDPEYPAYDNEAVKRQIDLLESKLLAEQRPANLILKKLKERKDEIGKGIMEARGEYIRKRVMDHPMMYKETQKEGADHRPDNPTGPQGPVAKELRPMLHMDFLGIKIAAVPLESFDRYTEDAQVLYGQGRLHKLYGEGDVSDYEKPYNQLCDVIVTHFFGSWLKESAVYGELSIVNKWLATAELAQIQRALDGNKPTSADEHVDYGKEALEDVYDPFADK